MILDDLPICVGCGLCCDGTMFHAIDLEAVDDVRHLQELGAVMVTDAQSRRLQQSCPAFDGCRCQVYESRPVTCREYSCALLDSVRREETSRADALDIIARARHLADSVRDSFGPETSSPAVHLGLRSLSSTLGILDHEIDRARLEDTFPEAAELIDILRTSFGWTNRTPAER